MEMTAERTLRPSDDLRSLSAWTWIDSTPEGLVSFCLLTPGPAGPGVSTMEALASSAGLATPNRPMPDSLIHLMIQAEDVVLTVAGTGIAIRVQAGPEWLDFVRRDGTVVVLVGMRPLDRGADRQAVERYMLGAMLPGDVWMGKTRLAAAFSRAQLEGGACWDCGTEDRPLHPGETFTLRVATGVVRDTVAVVCTPCLTKGSAK